MKKSILFFLVKPLWEYFGIPWIPKCHLSSHMEKFRSLQQLTPFGKTFWTLVSKFNYPYYMPTLQEEYIADPIGKKRKTNK